MTQAPQLPTPTWFVGCGNMGRAIIDGWRMAGLNLSPIVIVDPAMPTIEGVRTVATPGEAGPAPKLVVLGVKPQLIEEVAAQLKTWLTSKTTIVSLLVGVEAAILRQHFPKAGAIIRALPNLPVSVRRGVIALYSSDASDAQSQEMANIFVPLGFAPWMTEESKLAAVASVAGSGPAYVARFIAALAKAGEKRGLSREIAAAIALETAFGTAWLAAATSESMEALAGRVTSPNGTTQAGLAVLDNDDVLDQLIALTVDAAARRGSELANEAKLASLAEPERLS